MKTINVVALILAILGLLIWILDGMGLFIKLTNDPLNSGYTSIVIAWPLILIGIIVGIVGLFVKKK